MTETDHIGTLVENRFEILHSIGQGGMATVYKAEHKQVELVVAIKILKVDEDMSPSDVERLKREARALNSLFHPNIVKIYSFGILESGEPYLVLDFLEGETLDDIIMSGDLKPVDWAIEAFRQICRGLACAHDSCMIHRDLKPSNVMIVAKDDEGTFVKLLDFGIARSRKHSVSDQKLTVKGEIFGSPLYMSPEQATGKEVDHRADIYSFGCLMYETLCGQPPHVGESMVQTLMKHVGETPAPLSSVREIPFSLEAIVAKCMEKNPANRYQAVAEIEADLGECAANLSAVSKSD